MMGEFQESLVIPGDLFLGALGSEPKLLEMDETPPREFSGFSPGKSLVYLCRLIMAVPLRTGRVCSCKLVMRKGLKKAVLTQTGGAQLLLLFALP